MNQSEQKKSFLEIDTDKNRLDIPLIHEFLSTLSYWAKGRELGIVKRSIEKSLCFGAYLDSNQIGFARVVTDYSIFAWIMDVFILPEYRGNGYSKKLMAHIMNDDELQCIKRWGLATADAHGLYQQFGFTPLKKPFEMMEKI